MGNQKRKKTMHGSKNKKAQSKLDSRYNELAFLDESDDGAGQSQHPLSQPIQQRDRSILGDFLRYLLNK